MADSTLLTTGELNLPDQIINPWLKTVQNGSTVAALSDSIPMKFGKGEAMTFDTNEAEYVGEGANKGPSTYSSSVQTIEPFKFHKTVRWTEEVMWADEDYQLGVLDEILAKIQPSLSRALDYGVYHGINPADGSLVAAMTQKLDDAVNVVSASDDVTADLDGAVSLLLTSGYTPTGVALDPTYAVKFVTARNATLGTKVYPEFRPTTAVSTLDGWTASTSKTVSASGVAAADTDTAAFFGDFSAIRWGVQRQIPLKVIEYGDPDGQGDLKRNNQVAFRAEVVYGWGIADLDAFVRVTGAQGS